MALAAGLAVPQKLDFGDQAVHTTTEYQVSIENTGQFAIGVDLFLEGEAADCFAVGSRQLFLPVGQSRVVAISFVPQRQGALAARMVLRDEVATLKTELSLVGHGFTPHCQDDNPCTSDVFAVAAKSCRFVPKTGACDDGSFCTEDDSCVDGHCVGRRITCDDNIACTLDICSEQEGCLALPQDSRCGVASGPCMSALCDPELGCREQPAVEGTACGQQDCRQMKICLGGRCQVTPTPDGMPCDDGNACTLGETCRQQECVAQSVTTTGMSQPVEIDIALALAEHSSEVPNPAELLALTAPELGGVEVVWRQQRPTSGDSSAMVYRTYVQPDGSLLGSYPLLLAQRTRAAFSQQKLILAAQFPPGVDDPVTQGQCAITLVESSDMSLRELACISVGTDQVLDFGLTADADYAHLAVIVDHSDDVRTRGNLFHFQLDLSSLVLQQNLVHNWSLGIYETYPVKQPKVYTSVAGPVISFMQIQQDRACEYCEQVGTQVDCTYPQWTARLATDLVTPQAVPLVFDLGGFAKGVELVKLTSNGALAGFHWWGYPNENLFAACSPYQQIRLFERTPSGSFENSVFTVDQEEKIAAIAGIYQTEDPLLVVLDHSGQMRLLTQDAPHNEANTAQATSRYFGTSRAFALDFAQQPKRVVVTTELAGGLVLAAITDDVNRHRCQPMDAYHDNTCDGGGSRYLWDGQDCVVMGDVCGCYGADCGALYETEQNCLLVYGDCPEPNALEPRGIAFLTVGCDAYLGWYPLD